MGGGRGGRYIWGEAEGKVNGEWRRGPLDLVNRDPFSFHEAKATCLIESLSGAERS